MDTAFTTTASCLQLITLERGLDGRALPVAVRAGNALTAPNGMPIFLDQNGHFIPGAPTFSNPFTGFILPGAGASGINIIDNSMQNPMVQQSNLGCAIRVHARTLLCVPTISTISGHTSSSAATSASLITRSSVVPTVS